MRYGIALILGAVVGAAFFALGLIFNPFTGNVRLSPLALTNAEIIALNYSVVPSESIVYTNDGESRHAPYPAQVPHLWEAPVSRTSAMVTLMNDARGAAAGIGVKLSSLSESTKPLQGDVIIDSAWYIYLPERGGLFIGQSENYWEFVREVAFPAWRSSANIWRGSWVGDVTAGPGALGTAYAAGTSGELRGLEMEAVETLSVQAFSSDRGFIAAKGRLMIALPENSAERFAD